MRGLSVFIADIRNCRARELEEKRINKEMANIRSKFKESNLSGYHRSKYVAKLIYMYITGWPVDFGHVEAINLISSSKYHEKRMGYLAVTLLVTTDNPDFTKLIISSIRTDLSSTKETDNCLALCAIANMGGKELADSFASDVMVLLENCAKPFVKKKAALCLLRLYRRFPDAVPLKEWASKILPLMNDGDMGVKLAAASLVVVCAQQFPDAYSDCVDIAVAKLSQIVIAKDFKSEYVYYKVPAPWLQVKLLRLLQYYPEITTSQSKTDINKIIQFVLNSSQEIPKNVQQENAQHAVLFEAINLAIHLDAESDLVAQSTSLLSKFISAKETNLRYLGLDALAHLAGCVDSLDVLKQHYETIIVSLNDKDISVRRRALDLLYSMCDFTNYKSIVKELLQYLTLAEFAIREELVLKIAILTEKFSTDSSWYVDVMIALIIGAGDQISDDVWHRVVQIISNDEALQPYAARSVMNSMQSLGSQENLIKIGAYILGEYGHLIADELGYQPVDQLAVLQQRIRSCNIATRSLLLTTMLKFANIFPEIKLKVVEIFDQYRHVLDVELQQRACEYYSIAMMPSLEILETVCDAIPPFTPRESSLLLRLQNKLTDTEDKRTWIIGGKDANKQQSSSAGNSPPKYASHERDLGAPDSTQTRETNSFEKLILSSSGVLFEDSTVQIGVKSEYHQQLGRLGVYLGNKCTWPLTHFALACKSGSMSLKVSVIQPLGSSIPALKQECQMYNIECIGNFTTVPSLHIEYESQGMPMVLDLQLPVVLTKFVEPVALSNDDFFIRWRQIGGPPKESMHIFASGFGEAGLPGLLKSMNLEVLGEVDTNAANCVAAGIFNSTNFGKVGCLVRVEHSEEDRHKVCLLIAYYAADV